MPSKIVSHVYNYNSILSHFISIFFKIIIWYFVYAHWCLRHRLLLLFFNFVEFDSASIDNIDYKDFSTFDYDYNYVYNRWVISIMVVVTRHPVVHSSSSDMKRITCLHIYVGRFTKHEKLKKRIFLLWKFLKLGWELSRHAGGLRPVQTHPWRRSSLQTPSNLSVYTCTAALKRLGQ